MFAGAVRAEPARPLLTYYDDATGERTELSGATLENWVNKTANLLVDGCGLGVGAAAAVLLPPHWQGAAVLLGCWAAGLTVRADDPQPDVVFVAADRLDDAPQAPDRFVLGLAPMALPMREAPAGFVDYVAEVRGHGDHFQPYPVSQGDLCAAARDRADALGLAEGVRALIDAARHPDPVDWLLAPLTVGVSVVLCANLDRSKLAERTRAERVSPDAMLL